MKGLTLVGLLVVLAIVGVMMAGRLKPSTSTEGEPTITQPIDKANEAADIMKQERETNSAKRYNNSRNVKHCFSIPDHFATIP